MTADTGSGNRLTFSCEKGAGFGDGNHLRVPRPACPLSTALSAPPPAHFSKIICKEVLPGRVLFLITSFVHDGQRPGGAHFARPLGCGNGSGTALNRVSRCSEFQ